MKTQILVVDDDPVYRTLLATGLAIAGFDVASAKNGVDAKSALERVTPDVIVVDMLMPVLDGLGLLRWLNDERKVRIPAILLTAVDSRALSVEALVAGAAEVVLKPIGLEAIVEKINALVPEGRQRGQIDAQEEVERVELDRLLEL